MELEPMTVCDDIKTLIGKAAKANDSGDAMRFAQAAANAANACHALPSDDWKDDGQTQRPVDRKPAA
jgi:hypothetical protein